MKRFERRSRCCGQLHLFGPMRGWLPAMPCYPGPGWQGGKKPCEEEPSTLCKTLTPDIPPVLVWPVLSGRNHLSSVVPTFRLCSFTLAFPFRFSLVTRASSVPGWRFAHIPEAGPQSHLEWLVLATQDLRLSVPGGWASIQPQHPSTWYIASHAKYTP